MIGVTVQKFKIGYTVGIRDGQDSDFFWCSNFCLLSRYRKKVEHDQELLSGVPERDSLGDFFWPLEP